MDNKNFEDRLRDVCKKDIYIPQKFTNTIQNGLYENNRKGRFIEMKKIAVSILCIIFMGTGIVVASGLSKKFWNINNGVKTAEEYGYVQNITMDYNDQNNLGIKIDSIIIDNSNVGIVFNYKTYSKLKDIDNIVLNDLIIKDENNNIIFEDGNIESLYTGFTSELESENYVIKQAILLENSNHTYPKSNNLYISFSIVSMFKNQKKVETITGNWKFDIDVADKFISRETIKYTASRNEDVKIISAELTPTGLDIEMKCNAPLNAEQLGGGKMKIQDKDGKEYFAHLFNAEDELTAPTIKTSFPITTFNSQDNLKLIIKKDKEIIIDLTPISI